MASLTGNLAVNVELKSSADKFWEGLINSKDIFPKIFPEQYKSFEQIEGDGKSVGSVRKITFGDAIPIDSATEIIEFYDEASKKLSYATIDGGLLGLLKAFSPTIEVVPNGDGSIVKWTVVYEKASEETPEPEGMVVEMARKTFEEFDAYLVAN